MPKFHHVNLGVPTGGLDSQATFVVDVLGYHRIEVPGSLVGRANWFEADDGSQIHLSEDPNHRPAERAHVALHYGEELDAVRSRLQARSVEFTEADGAAMGRGTTIFCADPAGNRFELRG
jgi:catechol 2,3-dioxygenase-like lactoylglutathione lyase family enzyme